MLEASDTVHAFSNNELTAHMPATQYMRTESINLYCIIILSALDDYNIYVQLALKFECRPDYKKKKAPLGSMPRTKDPPA